MVLPTYLGITEAAKRIQQKSREPVTPEWLLQHASEGRLQLFALVRKDDVCVLTGAKPFGSLRLNTAENPPMSVMSDEVFDGDRFPLDYLNHAIRVVHCVGSRVPLANIWASRLLANRDADIYTISIDGEQASIVSSTYSNWRLHENGHIVGNAWPWNVSMNDLCFRSEDIESLIDANQPAAATHPKVSPGQTAEETPAERRAKLDITGERGCRRRILEGWTDIEKVYGPNADGRQVLRFLKQDNNESQPALKTVQNHLARLRTEKLIP